jgi:hypothetical protein
MEFVRRGRAARALSGARPTPPATVTELMLDRLGG